MTAGATRVGLLQFLPVFAIGGTERQVMNLTSGLNAARFDVHFGCNARGGEYLAEIEARRIPVTEYRIRKLFAPHTFRQQMRFASYLNQHRIDIVHAYNFYANCFAIPAAWLARTPVIVASIRDIGASMTPLQKRAQRMVCHLADAILVNAEAIRQWLISEGYSPHKLAVIHNGIDVARFGPLRTGTGLRQELGVPASAPVIAMLGRINRLKGVEHFLEAATALATDFPDARFLLIGDARVVKDGVIVPKSAYRSELEDYARRLGLEGRVVFAGFRRDVPDLLSQVTVSVLASLSEGLSNVVLESMAAAVPVVATRVGGMPEIIDDGVTGLLVPPRDSAALATAIRRILEDRKLGVRLGCAARCHVVERFSLERMVRKTEQFYLTLIDKARRRVRRPLLDPRVLRRRADVTQSR